MCLMPPHSNTNDPSAPSAAAPAPRQQLPFKERCRPQHDLVRLRAPPEPRHLPRRQLYIHKIQSRVLQCPRNRQSRHIHFLQLTNPVAPCDRLPPQRRVQARRHEDHVVGRRKVQPHGPCPQCQHKRVKCLVVETAHRTFAVASRRRSRDSRCPGHCRG